MRGFLRLLALSAFLLAGIVPAFAADEAVEERVLVADVRGPLEQRAIDFLVDVVRNEPGQLVVIQIDNPGIASGDPEPLFAAIEASTRPVTAWLGPSGAEAYGGAASLLELAAYSGAAPGARVGLLSPTVAGGSSLEVWVGGDPAVEAGLVDESVEVSEPIPGVVDEVVPTIGQFIASLNDRSMATASGEVVARTTTVTTAEDGTEIVVPDVNVAFLKPSLRTRFLRLAIRPEAMFFFLVIGLAAAAFEFYAAGVGITAAVASLALFLAGFGIAVLPMRWISLLAVLVGMVLYTVDFQSSTISWRGLLGTLLLLAGGLTITDAAPQFGPRWWAIVLSVVAVAAFYMVALTTVARSRFSTRTIGREHLVGKTGVAETVFDPTGIVEVDGARWKARSHRAAGVAPGDEVEVLAVSGVMLEVGPHNGADGRDRSIDPEISE
ncbi:MAG TPA: NfeD family protein [Acidimicrobiia bacterium]|jgi:membrane-bound serine protease (ClpP class)|nr:NfeD family protein [Acidimicrobiia bacterium]